MNKLISDSFTDFLGNIHSQLDSSLYYMHNNNYYRIDFLYNIKKETNKIEHYWVIPELNNTLRKVFEHTYNDIKTVSDVMTKWWNSNKKFVTVLNKKELKFKINESNSCWKTMKELSNNIKNGLEVPCTDDAKYKLDEEQIRKVKNRELTTKYKQAFEWLQDVVMDGDKDYAEKLLVILDKWKKHYEDKIRMAKSTLKEDSTILDIQPILEQLLKK